MLHQELRERDERLQSLAGELEATKEEKRELAQRTQEEREELLREADGQRQQAEQKLQEALTLLREREASETCLREAHSHQQRSLAEAANLLQALEANAQLKEDECRALEERLQEADAMAVAETENRRRTHEILGKMEHNCKQLKAKQAELLAEIGRFFPFSACFGCFHC